MTARISSHTETTRKQRSADRLALGESSMAEEPSGNRFDLYERRLRMWFHLLVALWIGIAIVIVLMTTIYSQHKLEALAQQGVILDVRFSDRAISEGLVSLLFIFFIAVAVTAIFSTWYAYKLKKQLLASGIKGSPAWLVWVIGFGLLAPALVLRFARRSRDSGRYPIFSLSLLAYCAIVCLGIAAIPTTVEIKSYLRTHNCPELKLPYRIDMKNFWERYFAQDVARLEGMMKETSLPYQMAGYDENGIWVSLIGDNETDMFRHLVEDRFPEYSYNLQNSRILLRLNPDYVDAQQVMKQAALTLFWRMGELGSTRIRVESLAKVANGILIRLYGCQDVGQVRQLIELQGNIELRRDLSKGESSHTLEALRTSCPEENPGAAESRSFCRNGSVTLSERKRAGKDSSPGRLFQLGPVVLNGRDFTNVLRGASGRGTSDLRIALTPQAQALLQRYDGGPLAFVVDDQVWGLVDPRALPDGLRVEVPSTEAEAAQLVRMIKSGALPVKLERLPATTE